MKETVQVLKVEETYIERIVIKNAKFIKTKELSKFVNPLVILVRKFIFIEQ